MRLSLRQPALLLIVSALVILPLGRAFADNHEVFIAWASSRSNELDNQWNQIRQSNNLNSSSFSSTPASFSKTAARRSMASCRPVGKVNWAFVNSSYTRLGNSRLLPRTSTPRNGPTRSFSAFEHPARGDHGLIHDSRRPASSQSYRTKRLSPRGSVSRPKLTHFGRASTGKRRSRVGNKVSPFSTRSRRR